MSFDVSGVDAARAARIQPQRPSGPPAAPRAGFADALAAGGRAARVDAIPASPPREVLDEMLAAQRAAEDMYARGRQLHFDLQGGRVRIQLHDLEGNVLKEIPPSRALELAGGGAVE